MYELLVVYGSVVALMAVIIYVMILAERGRRRPNQEKKSQGEDQRPEDRRAA
jgi:hypothetical protein